MSPELKRHATVELVDAMRGECPIYDESLVPASVLWAACLSGYVAPEEKTYAFTGGTASTGDHLQAVTCSRCLELMDLAVGSKRLAELAVHRDQLEERTGTPA